MQEKRPPWRARGRAFPALGKDEEAEGRFPGGKPPLSKRPFFSCKKGPKNTPEEWGVPPLRRRAGGGVFKNPPVPHKNFWGGGKNLV